MRRVVWGNTFIRAFKRVTKRRPNLQKDIENTLRLLSKDPFSPQIKVHKLKGKLSGAWACSAGYDLHIIFDFIKVKGQKEDDILLIEIGTHDEVY